MNTGVVIFLIVLFFVTLWLTLYVLKLEEKKMKKYEEEGDTFEDQLKRSHDYESESLRTSLSVQVWFYLGMVIVFIIGLVIYVKIKL